MLMPKQQLLDLFNQSYEFTSFIAAGNEIIVASLQDFAHQFTHIYGEPLSGKTHLLKAWVNLANQRYSQAIYIDGSAASSSDLLTLVNESIHRFIAVDNIDKLAASTQIQLFDIFNHIKLNGSHAYLLTSSALNLNVASTLRDDLKTRIYSGMVFGLKSLNDCELLQALNIYTKREGIKFGEAELKYILTYATRNLGELIALINRVGQTSLIMKKNITIPLIKTCMLYHAG